MQSKGPRVVFFVAHVKIYFAIPRNPGKRWKSQQNYTHSWLHVRNFCLPIVSMHDIIKFDYSACCHKKTNQICWCSFCCFVSLSLFSNICWTFMHKYFPDMDPMGRKYSLHPGKLTRNRNITHLKEKKTSKTSFLGFHVGFWGCIWSHGPGVESYSQATRTSSAGPVLECQLPELDRTHWTSTQFEVQGFFGTAIHGHGIYFIIRFVDFHG